MSDVQAPRSTRRAILTATGGALAALAANTLGRPVPVHAVNGEAIVVGGDHEGTAKTSLENTDASTTLELTHTSGFSGAALFAVSTGGVGVSAVGKRHGVFGTSQSGAGVTGEGQTFGIRGWSTGGQAGVYGSFGPGAPSTTPPNTGVYGWSTFDGIGVSYGVIGRSTAPLGFGVLGRSDTGTGVYASSKNGTALYANGRVGFKTSGIGTIASGSVSETIDPGVAISDDTRILVTLHGNPGGNVVLQRVAKSQANDTFTVHLTGAAGNSVTFSWFVIG